MIVILTIRRRMHLALATKQSLLDNGVDEDQIHIIEGYDKEDYKGMLRPHHLLTKGFMELVLPYAIFKHTSIFYTECGTLFNGNPFKIRVEEDRINWLGYIRNMKWYIVGTKLIYLPLSIMKDIKNRGVNVLFTTLDCYITEKMKKVVNNYSSCSIEGRYTGNVIKKRHVKGLKSKYLTLIRFIVTYNKEIKRTIVWRRPSLKYNWRKKFKKIGI